MWISTFDQDISTRYVNPKKKCALTIYWTRIVNICRFDVDAFSVSVDQTGSVVALDTNKGLLLITLDRPDHIANIFRHKSAKKHRVVRWNPHSSASKILVLSDGKICKVRRSHKVSPHFFTIYNHHIPKRYGMYESTKHKQCWNNIPHWYRTCAGHTQRKILLLRAARTHTH